MRWWYLSRLWLVMLLVCGATPRAWAHKISIFAHAHGAEIHGEVTEEGDLPVAGAKITALDPSDVQLAETVTDEKGEFRLTATVRCDWELVAEAEGHRATYTVPAAELPPSLPDRTTVDHGPAGEDHEHAMGEEEHGHGHDHADEADAHGASGGDEHGHVHAEETSATELASDDPAEIRRQIIALRRDVDQLRKDLRWQDVIGGVGYILGLIGISAYFLGGRRRAGSAS